MPQRAIFRKTTEENDMTAITEYGHGAPSAFRNTNRQGTRMCVDFRGVLAGMEAWLAQCFDAVGRMRHRQRQRRRLLELEDHILKDIGISRRQALEEGSKPFWK
jgi:uncharacterized protein YjiS (DUF1127 family)